ncbi:DarT ssDNA thymidine ADP-ribosyltransferase family protein [Pantoea agglomerans]|uniref:DarT ssDNA thymidine ADP-ribosyltransferase family protein n=1 Tax=Enterobacter agglomerans TaxID=549 RepID=UPI002B1E8F84|nr:DarT ssDNA thymidine ADP-ribosyltransferase family protein [Pantoea agglomerans]
MNIDEIIARRKITSILHFTTNRGLLGILATKTLKSRLRLNKDEHLAHIFQPNAAYRDKDRAWLDYVNLSISRINTGFFNTSSQSWHSEKNFWWCVLDFSPKILNHQGVNFTTTNNIYTGVIRKSGHDGLEAMFAGRINHWWGKDIMRQEGLESQFPTCVQAEVLYPKEISTEFLQAIYVQNDEIADEVAGQLGAMNHRNIPIITAPVKFTDMR